MAPQPPREKAPSRSQTWLWDAAKKRSGRPSAALLSELQNWVQDPVGQQNKLRDEALRQGRDPDGFVKSIAVTSQLLPPTRVLASRLKSVNSDVAARTDHHDNHSLSEEFSDNTETNESVANTTDLPAHSAARLQKRTTTTQPSIPSIARLPTRLGLRGGVQKPSQSRVNRALTGIDTALDRRLSSAKSTASPVMSHQPRPVAESSATAAARMPESDEISSTQSADQSNPFLARSVMPAWFNSVTERDLKMLGRKPPPEARELNKLKELITKCETMHEPELAKGLNDLRRQIHEAEFLHVTKAIIKKTRILTEPGLPRIFQEPSKFPWDLKADSWCLYERWMNESFNHNILRGIVTTKGVNRNGDKLDDTYQVDHPRDPKQYGNNGAVLGQWWPTQLCAVRDGIHGAPQGGIHGDEEQGAFSIVLSSGGYREDQDLGDEIRYSGTAGSDDKMTKVTSSMLKSSKLKNPIRVLRSSQLPKSNKYRPSCGLRYDGLYQIVSHNEVDKKTQMYVFHLERIAGQQPIRFEGKSKRPTVDEERAYNDCKGKGKFD